MKLKLFKEKCYKILTAYTPEEQSMLIDELYDEIFIKQTVIKPGIMIEHCIDENLSNDDKNLLRHTDEQLTAMVEQKGICDCLSAPFSIKGVDGIIRCAKCGKRYRN